MREDKETTINAECKAEAELWDIQYEGYFGVQDTIKLIDDIKVEMFDRGVKYAKRWRKVSEELPDKPCEVLVKDSAACMYIAYFSYGKFILDRYTQINGDIREWKPID